MQTTTIDQLPEVIELTDEDMVIVNQADTSRANLGKVKKYMQGELPEGLENSNTEIENLKIALSEAERNLQEQIDLLSPNDTGTIGALFEELNEIRALIDRVSLENQYPVGSGIVIGINDKTPIERGLPGVWENCSGRAEGYRLGDLPWPYAKYAINTAYAANAFVINPLGSGWGIYRATAAITAANNTVWNPAQWTLVLALAEGEHIPYRLFAATAVFAVNDFAVNYWADNYVSTQADYAANVAYAAGAFVRVLVEPGWWKIYKAPAAITAPNNTMWNSAQWEFVMDVRQGYKGVYQCVTANTAANPPVLNPAQWKQVSDLVPAYEYLPFVRYQQNANYTADTYVIWHLPGSGWELWKAKAAITTAVEQLDPVLWEKYVTGEIIERRFLQDWIDDDFEIGHTIEDGDYAGLCVVEMVTRGGTFPSYEGGNRPPFVTGGVEGDMTRNFPGLLPAAAWAGFEHPYTGPFAGHMTAYIPMIGYNTITNSFSFDPSRVVPTGPEDSPITFSFRFYRRVA